MAVKKYVSCKSNCLYEALDKEETLSAIQQALENGSVRGVDADAPFITQIKEKNTGSAVRLWIGTEAMFNAISTKEQDTLYIYTTDFESDVNDAIEELRLKAASAETLASQILSGKQTVGYARMADNAYEAQAALSAYTADEATKAQSAVYATSAGTANKADVAKKIEGCAKIYADSQNTVLVTAPGFYSVSMQTDGEGGSAWHTGFISITQEDIDNKRYVFGYRDTAIHVRAQYINSGYRITVNTGEGTIIDCRRLITY